MTIEENESNWIAAERDFAYTLKPHNLKIFQSYDQDLRRAIICQAIEDGVFTFWKLTKPPTKENP